ncbi:hypothetical protein B0T25DRAFT_611865 [Lasiosphaeria hispida]|uniref:Uncharacterized protein n=1 Tax=Lasiosphaeria hispida TaxID=260671 RepID=A0AAJ0HAR7_9PEZI|nr:hypothetical protein B0T25DRAFT_611865 [Lasiosphaeria hispida]
MRPVFLSALFVGVRLVAGAPRAAPTVHPELVARGFLGPRGVCEPDDLVRELRNRANRAEATPLCRSLLEIELSTSVVATVSKPQVFVFATETVTETRVEAATITEVGTVRSTATETVVVTTITKTHQVEAARDINARTVLSESLFQNYPETQIISACACISIPLCFKKATKTIGGLTETLSTATGTVYETSTATETAFSTTTEVSTTTESATATATVAPPAPRLATRPFRITSLNTAGGVTYFSRIEGPAIGDAIYQTTDIGEATVFVIDAEGRLTMNSPAFPSGVSIMYYSTEWHWAENSAHLGRFNLDSFISTFPGAVPFIFDIASSTSLLISAPALGFSPLIQTCLAKLDGVLRPYFAVGKTVAIDDRECFAISPSVEWVEDEAY